MPTHTAAGLGDTGGNAASSDDPIGDRPDYPAPDAFRQTRQRGRRKGETARGRVVATAPRAYGTQ